MGVGPEGKGDKGEGACGGRRGMGVDAVVEEGGVINARELKGSSSSSPEEEVGDELLKISADRSLTLASLLA